MSQTIEAIFDGSVLRPVEPLDIEPNTRVTVHIETPEREEGESYAFLSALREAKLEGPPDWSEHHEDYLYGKRRFSDDPNPNPE